MVAARSPVKSGATAFVCRAFGVALGGSGVYELAEGSGSAALLGGFSLLAAGSSFVAYSTVKPPEQSPSLDVVELAATDHEHPLFNDARWALKKWRDATSEWLETREAKGKSNDELPDDWPELILNAVHAEVTRIALEAVAPPQALSDGIE